MTAKYETIIHSLINQGVLYEENVKNARFISTSINVNRERTAKNPMVVFAKPPQSGKTTDILALGFLDPKPTCYLPSLNHKDFKEINTDVLKTLNIETKSPLIQTLSMDSFIKGAEVAKNAIDFLGGDIHRFVIDEFHWGSRPNSNQHKGLLKIQEEYPKAEIIFVSASPWTFATSKMAPENREKLSCIEIISAGNGDKYSGVQALRDHSLVNWVDTSVESQTEEKCISEAVEHLCSFENGAFLYRIDSPRANKRAEGLRDELQHRYPDVHFLTINSNNKTPMRDQWDNLSILSHGRRCFAIITLSGIAGTDLGNDLKENTRGIHENLDSAQGVYQGLMGRVFKYDRENFNLLFQVNLSFVDQCVLLEENRNNLADSNLDELYKDAGLSSGRTNITTNLVHKRTLVTYEHKREFLIVKSEVPFPLKRYAPDGTSFDQYGRRSDIFEEIVNVFENVFSISRTSSGERSVSEVRNELAAEHLNASSRNHADYILRKKFHGGENRYIATKDDTAWYRFGDIGALNQTYLDSQKKLEASILDPKSSLHVEMLSSIKSHSPHTTSSEIIEAHNTGRLVMLSMKVYLDNPRINQSSERDSLFDQHGQTYLSLNNE